MMMGPDIDLSIVKRKTGSIGDVRNQLESSGFEQTASILGGRVEYHENDAGFNVTAIDGPMGVVIIPSGPVRGKLFGDNSVGINIERDSSSSNNSASSSENNSSGESHTRGSDSEDQVMV